MKNYRKLLFLFLIDGRKPAIYLLFLTIVVAFVDLLGIASILPFMTVLSNPSVIETNSIFKSLYETSTFFGAENQNSFVFILGLFLFMILLISLATKALAMYAQVKFVQKSEYNISKTLIESYIQQPYAWFLNRHSADLGKNILSEVNHIISYGIRPLIELISKTIIVISILVLLIIINPKLTLMICLNLGLAYGSAFFVARKYLKLIGGIRVKNNKLRFMSINEIFNAIKEIKIKNLEKFYTQSFSNYSKKYVKTLANSQIISQIPRFILEAVVFGGIILIILLTNYKTGDFTNQLPVLSLYIFAGYRLMPGLQQIYASLTQLAFINDLLNKIYYDLQNKELYHNDKNDSCNKISFQKKIILKKVYYNYPYAKQTALIDLELIIPAKSKVGIIGTTGSGKTTLIDIILGLLEPKSGTLQVDGRVINKKNIKNWQQLIGYVPQHIYLSDDTIEANIAFGKETKDVNKDLLENVSKIARLHNFILDTLPNQYKTKIGEQGVRLSGGQRQRIGIARALYNNPKLLILDEATSALDVKTEKDVMDGINKSSKDITIITIAHRLDTLKNYDIIFKLENGQIIESGSFDKVINKKVDT